MIPPRLRIVTPRLLLCVPETDCAAEVAAFYARNRSHLSPWEPQRSERFYTEEFWRRQLAENLGDFEDGYGVPLFLFAKDDPWPVIGFAGFSDIVRGSLQSCRLGYALDEGAVGKGLMTEALRPAVAWVFEALGLHRITASHAPSNERSGRVLSRLGFVVEGYAREYLYVGGAWQDHVLTALTNRDAPPPSPIE